MSASQNRDDTDIAVIGISAILASGENLNENWESIRAGLNHVSDLPADRVDVTAYFNPDKTAKDQVYCKRGYFIPDYELDPRDYGLNFNQVEDSDANQLLTLLKVKEALSDAKIHPVSKERRNVGVVLGIGGGQKASHEFYSRLNYVVMEKVLRKMGMPDEDVKIAIDKYKSQFPEWRVDSFPGFLGNVTAGRCCNVFNLDGMNCVVDAACASSLIALKVAIDELLYGDCDTMVCGATCTDNSLGMYMAFSKTPVFSTDPAVRAYDENTKGMLIGEGSVMMVLKKLSKAVADGDEIHAVIRGVASSSDGKAPGIYVPTVSGQELCIQRAWEKVKAEMKTCTLLEGHGTGTPVGDKIELTGMRNQFQTHAGCAKEQIAVGSIKSQVGHTKAVAGFAGLVKVILSLKHKTLPLTINVQNPPKLMDGTDLTDTCLYVNLKNRPWFVPREIGIRRAGISSFGFGGANYHMVVEEYEQEHTKPYRMHDMALPIVIHATNARELVAELRSVIAKIEPLAFSNDKTPQDEAYDLLMTYRKEHEVGAKPGAVPASSPRVGLLASDKPRDFVTDLKNIADAIERDSNATEIKLRADLIYRSKGMDLRGKVAALFAGQGSQYLNMYEDVAMNFPEFRQAVVDMDKASSQICGVRASSFMYPRAPYQKEGEELIKKQEKEISTVQNAQLAITAVSIGGFAIFQRAGFKPDFVAGHSLGEYAAMHACGALDRAEVCELVCARAHAMQNAFQKGEDLGKMIAVVGDNVESKVRPEAEGVWVANMNSPSQVVLTGTQKGIEQDAARLTGLGFRVVTLNTGGAFHSPKMAPAERVFYERLAASKINPIAHDAPRAYANVSGSVYPAGDAEEVRRTLAKQMTSAVQFTSQIRQMYKDGARVFVEFGPKNVLAKLVQQILADANDVACVSLNASPNRSSDAQLREAALQCAVLGVPFSSPFDPWGKRNPFKGIGGFFSDREADLKARQSKTRIKLSAATYVSKKTLEERTRLMNDGRILSCFTASSPRSAGNPDAASSSLKEELARLRSQLEDAKREAAEKKLEAEKLRQIVETTKAQSSDSMTANQKLHLDQLLRNYEDLTKQIKSVLVGAAPSPALAAPVSVPVAPLSLSAPAPATTIAATPAASTSGRLGRAEVESTLKNALGELTGFDIGLVTMDLSLEDDLGIDSIKRVEFVSNVSAKFGVTVGPEAMDKLARTRLVGEVVEVFVSTLGASGSSAPAPVTAAPVAVAKSVTASTGGFDRAFVTKTLNKVLSASTGFAEDLISEDMSLEDDLGVDSIKRVELVSAASADLNVTVSQEAMTELSRSRTVGDVINAFFAHVGSSSPAPAPASAAPVTSKPAAVSTAPAATGGFDRSKVIKTLNKVLAASTGFSEDLISEDMSLEDDLGVDSIKRVELVSAASADLNVTVSQEAMTELSRSRTVGDVINAFFNHVGGSAAPAVASAPMVAAAPVASAAGGFDRAKVIKTLNKVLSASTGFSEDLISEDMSLEDDLGVDSIKRVELVSAASADLNVTVSPQAMTELSRSRTVGDVINAFFNHVGGSASAAPAAAAPVAAAKVASAPAAATGGFNRGQVIKTLNKVLSASTGFSEDLISEDMSLEDDLGVDSIKRVELVSAASADLNVTVSQEAMTELSRSRTVGDVINAFFNHVGGSAAPAAAPAPVAASPVAIAAPAKSASAASGFSRDQVIKTLNKVLSASTGFSEDLISEDMSLEDDLGVDSIKRVELVSAASADLNVTVSQEAMTELSRSRTVGDVINAFFNHVGGSTASAAAPVAAAPVSAAKPASAPATGGFSRDQVIKTLNKVLSASTGFSEDLISEDMSLEDDLGVDSIKRVELVSAASADMSVTVSQEAMTELSRSRTVGDVINAFFNHVGGSASAAPAAVAPAPSAPVPAAAPAKPAASGFSRDQVIKTLNKVLSASTGFSEDLISEDMSLEDDLGVDSIKRVELVSAASADLNVTVSQEAMTELSRSRTVGDVINAFFNHVGGSAAPAATPAAAAPAASAPAPAPAAAASNGMDRAQVTKVLQQVLSDSTGFSEDLITEDMSLEDDLGVDSIKRVELVSSASATLQVSVSPQAMTELSRSRTVGDVINAFFTHVGSSSSAAAPSAAPVSNGDGAVKPIRAADCGHLTLTYAEAVVIPAPDRQALERSVDRPTLILDDGTGLASQLAEKLGAGALVLTTVANGKKSIVMKDYTEASFEQALAQVVNQFGKPGGFVFLPNANQDISKQMAFAMLAAKQLKPYLADVPVTRGRSFFIGVARMDGKLGLGGCADVKNDDLVAVAERGAIFGLCKTLDLEWPHVFSRGVDLDVKLSNDKCVEFLLRELDDPNLNVREVGYSAADLKRRTTKALPLVPTAKANKAKISKSDVFIVTGGARGITPLCVAEVARLARGGTFFLLGRSKVSPEPAWANGKATGKELDDAATAYAKAQFAAGKGEKPTPKVVRALSNSVEATREIAESLAMITAAGGKAEYISADVSNPEAVTKALQGRAGSVTGLIHASGVLRDKMIQNKTMDDFEAVYGTKVYGLRALLKALPPKQLKHMIVFSSLAGFHGNRGQADYALANEVLNKSIHVMNARFPNCDARALDFGPWGGGMVTPQLQKMFEDQGVEIIPRSGGAVTVANVLFSTNQAQALFGNWGLPPVKPIDGTVKVQRTFLVAGPENKFLDSHKFKNKRVLPFTLMSAAMGQMAVDTHPGYHLHSLQDVQLFRGFVAPDNENSMPMTFTLVDGREEAGKLEVDVSVTSILNGKEVPSYRCKAVLGPRPRSGFSVQPLSKEDLTSKFKTSKEVYDNVTLFHGPDFQSISGVNLVNESKLVAECKRVNVQDQGQFAANGPVDGFTLDTAFQLALVSARVLKNVASLPNFAKSFDFYREIPVGEKFYGVLLKDAEGEAIKGDVTMAKHQFYFCDAEGNVFMGGRISIVLSAGLTW